VVSGDDTATGSGLRVIMCLYKFHICQGPNGRIKVLTHKDSKSWAKTRIFVCLWRFDN
jgi:hypothetical protein